MTSLLFIRPCYTDLLGRTRDMEKAEIITLKEIGSDYILLHGTHRSRRVRFADDSMFSKEDAARSFELFLGKAAIVSVDGPFRIAIDFETDDSSDTSRVHWLYHTIASIDVC